MNTSISIKVRSGLFRLLNLKVAKGLTDGLAISNRNGTFFSTHVMNDYLHDALEEIDKSQRNLFNKTIKAIEKLRASYQVFRSLRRSYMKIYGDD